MANAKPTAAKSSAPAKATVKAGTVKSAEIARAIKSDAQAQGSRAERLREWVHATGPMVDALKALKMQIGEVIKSLELDEQVTRSLKINWQSRDFLRAVTAVHGERVAEKLTDAKKSAGGKAKAEKTASKTARNAQEIATPTGTLEIADIVVALANASKLMKGAEKATIERLLGLYQALEDAALDA